MDSSIRSMASENGGTAVLSVLSAFGLIIRGACFLTPCVLPLTAFAADPTAGELAKAYSSSIQPILMANCFECHAGATPEADLDLSKFATLDQVTKGYDRWAAVLERLEAKEMPPDEAKQLPTAAERQAVIEWIRQLRANVLARNAGDPGPVLARRLSSAEYNYTIRDLTGVDIRPTKEFPVDPTNSAGFDNSGESLAMSPALLQKYLDAARLVTDYIVFKPEGFDFAPHPVVSDTDRDRYCVLRIVDFYKRQPTDLADYFLAAWRFEHRASLGRPDASPADVAAEAGVSPKYLAMVWAVLEETPDAVGPIAKLQAMWRELPAPDAKDRDVARAGCVALRDWVVELRQKLQIEWNNLRLKRVGEGSQPFILWKNRQYATHRMTYDPAVLQIEGASSDDEPSREVDETAQVAEEEEHDDKDKNREPPRSKLPDPDLAVPADAAERARYESAFARFCAVFPDTFYRSERGRMHFNREKERRDKGRFLTAGFHNSAGYFRDDIPLCELVLDDVGRREIDELWRELDFVTEAPMRQHADFIFYERAEGPRTIKGPEFDFIRSEDKDASSEAKIKRMAEVYVANARASLAADGGKPETIPAIEEFFASVNANIRRVERERLAAEPKHVDALVAFAERAYRRPLSAKKRDDLARFYRSLREEGELDHESAIRDSVVSVLMSPHFMYRLDLVGPGAGRQPLPEFALASRLSYFLWSSMPDDELLAHAKAGDLHRPEVMASQTRRMLADQRARALAVEFGGNWLDIRRFEEHNAVDRDRFPSFDNDLREAMFEEPIRFFIDVIENDRSVLDFIYAKDTFVNPALSKHYGMPAPTGGPDDWVQIADAESYGRGGLLPMAVFLTKNAPGLRTSPVKRGYWVVRRVLGEVIPPPPAVVPELPHDEAKLGDLTLREVLERHRADPSCAACHARFDSFGLVFEGYGPIGERRDVDLGGRTVDAHANFPGGSDGTGVPGLLTYIRSQRQSDFIDNLCRKMLAYALGRTLILSDEPTVDEMKARLEASDYRYSSLVESIVTSPQFLTKRGKDDLARSGE